MGFNKFVFRLILIVSFILLTALALSFIWPLENRLFTKMFVLILLVSEAIWLFYTVSRTNRDLRQFFISLESDDLSSPIKKDRNDKMFVGLYEAFEKIQSKLFKLRITKEREYQLFQIILNQTGSGILIIDNEGQIKLSNPAAILLLGLGDLKNINQLNMLIPGSGEFIESLPKSSSKTWNFIRSGHAVELLVQSTPIKIEGDDYTLISLMDIKKQLNEKAFRSQKDIIRVLSHEINNTLTPITTLTDALIRNSITPEDMLNNREDMMEGLDIIRDRSNNILDFVNNYRELSHLPDPDMKWFGLSELIDETIRLNQKLIIENKTKVHSLTSEYQDLMVQGDRKLLGQVLQNLLKNAFEALEDKEGGEINFNVEFSLSGNLCLSINDNGMGIPDDIREKLFTPFFSTKKEGNGIGLCLSQQIMKLHDGEIDIRTQKRKGTEITLLFRSHNIRSNSEHILKNNKSTNNGN